MAAALTFTCKQTRKAGTRINLDFVMRKLKGSLFFLEVQSGVLIFCDDQSVEKAVSSAVSKFNDGLSIGHKLALYQILSATKVRQL